MKLKLNAFVLTVLLIGAMLCVTEAKKCKFSTSFFCMVDEIKHTSIREEKSDFFAYFILLVGPRPPRPQAPCPSHATCMNWCNERVRTNGYCPGNQVCCVLVV